MAQKSKLQYTAEEEELIEELEKEKPDFNKVRKSLADKIGDMSFNAKLRKDSSPDGKNARGFLKYYTYKTRELNEFANAASKLETAFELRDKQLPTPDDKKITLADCNKIFALKSINDLYEKRLEDIYVGSGGENGNGGKNNNNDFHELYTKIKKSSDLIEKLSNGALETKDYKAGDLMMYVTAKTAALKGRQNLSGHEGKLEEQYITRYNHAAPLYIDYSDPTKPIVTKSDIWRKQRSDAVSVEEILEADTLRIDPTKLVSKEYIQKLEKIDYGYKQDEHGKKIKLSWQEVMQDRYEQLSNALHLMQIPDQIKQIQQLLIENRKEFNEVSEKLAPYRERLNQFDTMSTELKEWSKELNNLTSDSLKHKELKEKISDKEEKYKELEKIIQQEDKEYQKLEETLNIKGYEYHQLEEEMKIKAKIKESQLIQNDQKRLGAGHWVNPKTILEGHDQWFSKNNFRDLSQKMYNANPEQRAMICSEFAARSIASTMDQLNRLTALDLQAAGVINKEERIIKQPIPKNENFNNLHPERLVKILEKSGCVERVENKFLKELINLESTNKSKNKAKKRNPNLAEKIYKTLPVSKNIDDFKNQASEVVKSDLRLAGIEDNVSRDARTQVLNDRLPEIYNEYTQKPKGVLAKIKNVSTKVLVFCKLCTKDAQVKKKLEALVNEIIETNQAGQQKNSPANIINNDELSQQTTTIGKELRAGNISNNRGQAIGNAVSDQNSSKSSKTINRSL